MDRAKEVRIWRRSVAVGVLALALSVGGQVFAGRAAVNSCSLAAHGTRASPGATVAAPTLVQHLARLALSFATERCE